MTRRMASSASSWIRCSALHDWESSRIPVAVAGGRAAVVGTSFHSTRLLRHLELSRASNAHPFQPWQ